ncbi:uncharacterized protein LOC131064861 [Cryptomeria japonica]|uniref:uncharacterized protein LOC131064861 n=1 Tax=Cryptomeria japonica TaxID=3369 RepID=UPI0025AB660A|nr:uncharacterized protein LOC131064861 [Cryptomeria japonica]
MGTEVERLRREVLDLTKSLHTSQTEDAKLAGLQAKVQRAEVDVTQLWGERDAACQDIVKANKDDPFVENAHISEDYDSSDSDEDSSNLPPKKKSRVSKKAEEDVEEKVDSEQEQEKEVKEEKKNEHEKKVEGEEGDKDNEQRKEDVDESEAKESPYDLDNRDDVQNNMEGNPRFEDSTQDMEDVDTILNSTRNNSLEMFNFQK